MFVRPDSDNDQLHEANAKQSRPNGSPRGGGEESTGMGKKAGRMIF